jgi:hypothetical protein
MEQLVGLTIKTHSNGIVGQVVEGHSRQVGTVARSRFGIAPGEPYVALSVLMSDGNWTTLIGRDGWDIHKRYVM